ncbi:MAG: hypothetical protein ACRENJ_00400, partial [Candidatus Eiseniibacteriota bacterium]
ALTGESVTDEEWSWDVGNLPRLLDAIGLGEAFPDWREEIESGRAAVANMKALDEAARKNPPDLVQPILDRLGAAGPGRIAGGPVITEPALLWLVPWACENDVEIGFIATPSRATRLRRPRGLEHLCVVEKDGAWRIGHPWVSVWTRETLYRKLQTLIKTLPAGSTLELVSASVPDAGDEDPPVTAGDMRFKGVIERGRWKVTHASPAATKKQLEAALEIFGWIAKRGAFPARTAAEARAVTELGRTGRHYSHEAKDQPVVSGRTIALRSRQWRHYLAMDVFRHRFAAGPWDAASGQAAELQSGDEFDQMLAALGDKLSQAFAAPRGEETVFEGKASTFRKADILAVRSKLDLAELFRRLYPARDPGASVDLQRAVTIVHEAMVAKGMASLGDMVCEAFGDVVIRGYAREAGDVYGLTYAGTMGQFIYEFNTQFSDGSSLTTSIHHGQNRKELKFHHAQFPNASVEELLDHHLAAVDKRTTEKVKPVPHPMALATLAERIDDFLLRTAA